MSGHNDEPSEPASPAVSVYSLTPSIREASFVTMHGRLVNNRSDVYRFPADAEEVVRLEAQHEMLKTLVIGKNYAGPVAEHLLSYGGSPKSILDLGCGTGQWAFEMTQEFPNAEVVGVDLSPIQTPRTRDGHRNCRFEVDDINLGLPHFYNTFDMVHARFIAPGISDYRGLVDEISKILHPGGVALLQEIDYRVYNANRQPMHPVAASQSSHAWLPHWLQTFSQASRLRSASVDAAQNLMLWVRENNSFYADGCQDLWLPIGPFYMPETETDRLRNAAGEAFRKVLKEFIKAGRITILNNNVLTHEQIQELESICVWARRLSAPTASS